MKCRAEKIKCDLETIDADLFQRLRDKLSDEKCRGSEFKEFIGEYVDLESGDEENDSEPGYDILDVIINGLTSFQTMPEQSLELEPEMVYFQKTPARVVFELVGRIHFGQ